MSKIHQLFSLENAKETLIDENIPLFLGLECEIESVKSGPESQSVFAIETDGSLRNSGFEFISKPLAITEVVPEFTKLHTSLHHFNLEERFSQRTSIHVHVNVLNLEEVVVKNIVLLYALYEEFFFMLVAPDRRDNIHCVPLTETHLPNYYQQSLPNLVKKWHKYTALNIKPISGQGTIEFRHMQGHDNPKLLGTWIQTIENLVEVAKRTQITSDTLTSTNIHSCFMSIFGHTQLSILDSSLESIASNQIIDLKLALL